MPKWFPFFSRTKSRPKPTEKDFVQAVKVLTKRLEKSNSLKMVFLRGILTGVGTALGATIIAGLVIWILYQFISSLESLPFFEDLLDSTIIDELLEEQVQTSTNGS